ncbi:hypothetical protein B6N25_15325 [Sphingobacteriales bacterium TSM_CSS]|nr:hypothetical protein B6N25_15325 [Sphingobacteriales bacterium TSM_CSS]
MAKNKGNQFAPDTFWKVCPCFVYSVKNAYFCLFLPTNRFENHPILLFKPFYCSNMFNNIGTTELLVFAIGAIIVIYILMRVARFFFRILFFVAVIAALFYFISGRSITSFFSTPTIEGLFEKTTLTNMYHNTCKGGTATDAKCACIVNVVYSDLKVKYTDAGIKDLDNNKMLLMVEVRSSVKKHASEMEACLKQKGSEGLKFLEILKDVVNKPAPTPQK